MDKHSYVVQDRIALQLQLFRENQEVFEDFLFVIPAAEPFSG